MRPMLPILFAAVPDPVISNQEIRDVAYRKEFTWTCTYSDYNLK